MFRLFDDDPFFRDPMADLHEMMGLRRPDMQQGGGHGRQIVPHVMASPPFNMMGGMFGGGMLGGGMFGGLGPMMRNMDQPMRMVQSNQSMPGASFQSSFTSISYGNGDGQPKVYKSSSTTKVGPSGVKETQKTEEDSETGLRKIAIGHHIDDRSHVIEKSQNTKTGDNEQSQEFINLEEDEAQQFDQEFKQRINSGAPSHSRRAISNRPHIRHSPYSMDQRPAAIEYHRPQSSPRAQPSHNTYYRPHSSHKRNVN